MSDVETTKCTQGSYFDGHKLGVHQLNFLWIIALCYAFEFVDGSLFNYASPILMATWGLTIETISFLSIPTR